MRSMRRLGGAILIAGMVLAGTASNTTSDPDLTALVNAAYGARTEDASLHALAHERAAYQVANGGLCPGSLTHEGLVTAEVLACNNSGPDRAVVQWQNSPEHHALLSDPGFNLIGCGSATANGFTFYACVLSTASVAQPTPMPAPGPEGQPSNVGGSERTPLPAATPLVAKLPNTAICDRRPEHPKCTAAPTATPTASATATPTPQPTISPPTSTPSPTPAPSPSTPTCDHFLSPTGTDSGTGPWRTILYASAQLAPGEVLCARGGTYTGQGGYNWKSSGTLGNPVTIKAYPGETPLFDGSGWSHGIIVSGYSHVVIDGLHFNGYGMGPSGDGSILLLNATHVTIQNTRIINSGSGFQQDHHVYINSGCSDITIRSNYFAGTPGAAVHIYHDPGPQRVLIEDNDMLNGYWGVVVGSNANGVQMVANRFGGNTINMDNQRGTNVTASGNSPNDVIQ